MIATTQSLGTQSLGVTLLERIGNTPLLRLERLTAHLPGVQILGKAEWVNPGGSIKDRAAASIVLDAEKRGLLKFHQRKAAAPCSTPPAATPASPTPCSARRSAFPSRCACPPTSPRSASASSPPTAPSHLDRPADGSDGAIRKARAADRRRARPLLLRRPVRQRAELEGPLPHHRQRDLEADRGPGHPLRRRPRHQRHLHGHHAPPARSSTPRSSASPCSRIRPSTDSKA